MYTSTATSRPPVCSWLNHEEKRRRDENSSAVRGIWRSADSQYFLYMSTFLFNFCEGVFLLFLNLSATSWAKARIEVNTILTAGSCTQWTEWRECNSGSNCVLTEYFQSTTLTLYLDYWSLWSPWTSCSHYCGGSRSRSRHCIEGTCKIR